jgi:hypothetical protein
MSYNNKTERDGQGICELFSEYFSSVYDEKQVLCEPTNLPTAHNFPLQYLRISEQDIFLKIKHLNVHKGAGPDEIPPKFIKLCSDELVKPLAILYSKSIASGIFPARWKIAHIIPIFKAGDRNVCSNYWPISILSCLAKLFESLVYTQVYNHFILYIQQPTRVY